jgi:hypothetical protein
MNEAERLQDGSDSLFSLFTLLIWFACFKALLHVQNLDGF